MQTQILGFMYVCIHIDTDDFVHIYIDVHMHVYIEFFTLYCVMTVYVYMPLWHNPGIMPYY